MLESILRLLRQYEMVQPGDRVICAVSGGADSVALLLGMYLLREKWQLQLEAAHFNHGLRGEESDRDEAFVRTLCTRYEIPLHVGRATVVPGKKGLEAAARAARYGFFETLPGKLATAHTADDNAETVLMHLVRGTGLKGLGAIAPVRGNIIRPMLLTTRQQVLEFLEEYHQDFVTDSSNETDAFLRNRLRHHVMPLLYRENPRLAENLSAMALRLREDEAVLEESADFGQGLDVAQVKRMPKARRSRVLAAFLESCGVREPEAEHIALAESLVFSENPSARGDFPGGVRILRQYEKLVKDTEAVPFFKQALCCPGVTELPSLGLRVVCTPALSPENTPTAFTVAPQGPLWLRPREQGDTMRLCGGTKTLKKLFIDRKLPAAQRGRIPVVCDDAGVLGVYSIGVNLDRASPKVLIRFEEIDNKESEEPL